MGVLRRNRLELLLFIGSGRSIALYRYCISNVITTPLPLHFIIICADPLFVGLRARGTPQPLSDAVVDQCAILKGLAEYAAELMQPWEGADWIVASSRQGVDQQLALLGTAYDGHKLWEQMPRNPATSRYEPCHTLEEKNKFFKELCIIHRDQVAEVRGEWCLKQTPLPDPESKWYHPQFQLPSKPETNQVNTFLVDAGEGEHWCRKSYGFSLPAAFVWFSSCFSAEVIYEMWSSLPRMVGTRRKGARPR